ncbi:Ferredoxin [Marinospirillum celere]|uniref:Ferredoxin n=1 Tax=Marinospirillum celere TaxID=1122252 RepID=A0A1I1J9N9_9GAMM|nr:2Fe-2S iron-sulfur cluster-binding protein [Marinospirillum celere]SFC42150.1 Ferredoxin [Marinospirillum celere]
MALLWVGATKLSAAATQPLLDSLQAGGLAWRESCRNGVCGVCACQLIRGQIDYRGRQPHALDAKERKQGKILPCIAYPASEQLEISSPAHPLNSLPLSSL